MPLPVVCQPYYNLLNRMPEVEILPACDHYGIGVATYSPLARGVLTGKYAPGGKGPEDSRGARGDQRMLETEFREESFVIAAKLGAAREKTGRTSTQIRARLDVGQPDRDLGDRGTAHARAMERLRRRDRHAVEPRTRRWSIRWCGPGHPSTPGYNDPQYPFFGRVLELTVAVSARGRLVCGRRATRSPSRHGNRAGVFRGRQRARPAFVVRAGRVVRVVEVEHEFALAGARSAPLIVSYR